MPQTNNQAVFTRIFTDVLAAGAIKIYEISRADRLFLSANTGAVGTLQFSLDAQQNVALLVGQIIKTPGPFQQIVVKNADTGSATFTFVIANGDIDFKGLVLSTTISTIQAQSSVGVFAADVATGAAAKVFTGISNYGVILMADFANTNQVYIGFDITVSATKKIIALAPGEKYVFDKFKGDLFAFSAAAQVLSVSYST